MYKHIGWVLALGCLPAVAFGQEPMVFELETVLVAPVQAITPDVREEAERVTEELARRLGEVVLAVDIRSVPDFDVQGYTARTYMESCPPGQYGGCALVAGQRGNAHWVVGGTLSRVEDDLFGASTHHLLELHFIDVRGSRELLAFGVVLAGDEADEAVYQQLVGVVDRVVDGAFDEVDIRGDLSAAELQAALDRTRAEAAASELQQLEETLDGFEQVPIQALSAPRLTRDELRQQYGGRDSTAPWERLGMTEHQFVRFQNSGRPLQEWQRRLEGRFGQVLLRAGFLGGSGPWGVHHEGQYLLAFNNELSAFETVEIVQFQELRRAGTTGADLELGFGVAPWVEVGVGLTFRSSRVTFLFDQDTEGEPSFVGNVQGTTASTLSVGPRATFVPMPTYQVRPTLSLGLSWWSGRGVPADAPFERLQTPKLTVLQIAPGVEASASKFANVFARVTLDQPVGGRYIDERYVGGGRLERPPAPQEEYGLGLGVLAGVQFRVNVLSSKRQTKRAVDRFDDEPDEL